MGELATQPKPAGMQQPGLRRRVFELLASSTDGDRASRIVDLALIGLILASVVAVILESIPSVEAAHGSFFRWFETVTVAIFTIEYLLRVWCAVESDELAGGGVAVRLRYICSPSALIDLLAILPFYVLMFWPAGQVDLRFLRCVRLLRILKLTRYSRAFDMLASALKDNLRSLAAAFFILIVVMLLAATGMYYFERHAQPVAFRSIPDAMWWAVSTLTTVGYGDVTPITTGGKVFGALITVVGVGMVALPTGILASGYSLQAKLHSERFREAASRALSDGIVTAEENDELERTRLDLSLSRETADRILETERTRAPAGKRRPRACCPNCGQALGPVT